MTKIKEIILALENWAKPKWQEKYDNSGIQVGDVNDELMGVLVNLDLTLPVLLEAVAANCNLIIVHHPIIFGGISTITPNSEIGQILIAAIKNNVCIYALHTNLDNLNQGVNAKIAQVIGLSNTKVLKPMAGTLATFTTYCPTKYLDQTRQALFNAGAGHIGEYDMASFSKSGIGTFRGLENSKQRVGIRGQFEMVEEYKIEVIHESGTHHKLIDAVKSVGYYEEVAYNVIQLINDNPILGSGMIGELTLAMEPLEFLQMVKEKFKCGVIKYTEYNNPISKVAICGGSGYFLLNDALKSKADAYITADIKYHQFFEPEQKLMLLDIGHYESEQYTTELICDYLMQKFSTFAILISRLNTNPVKYY
ncbi:MAG: Nif3-like dinuclear metal center hexameric protein [Bacteroidota bacterium]|nr:Nif3-like dinuclear metal center hexameric protein [Bacteroidota bacterium]